MKDIQHIESMLSRYKSLHSPTLDNCITPKVNSYRSVIGRYNILKPTLHELDKTEAGHYNLFEIIKVNYREVELHTPMLSNLLNPKGSHAQGTFFLRRFIETVFDAEDKVRFATVGLDTVTVQDEMPIRNGQIDIFVQCRSANNRYLWIIENKIYAPDQNRQLTKYYEYALSLSGYDQGNIRLLYLKPFKSNPSTASIDRDSLDTLYKSGVFKVISYDKHILTWLQDCLEEIKAPVVKYTIMQYIHSLKTICR